ncbi:MAG: PHP domain-containing protein [Candidatus Woesearchaeota archaeon]
MLLRARVDFKKPDLEQVRDAGMKAVDMHFHTQYSDTYTKIDKILKKAQRLGIGIAITDHNEIKGVLEAAKLKEGQMLIPGIEVSCLERCHLLFYFQNIADLKAFYYNGVEQFKNKDPYSITQVKIQDIMKEAENFDCLVCAAHPFMRGFMGIYKNISRGYVDKNVLSAINAIEVINGVSRNRMNWKALEWAEELGKGFTGGSDGHSLFQLGKVLTYSKANSVKGFIENIRNGENFVVGKEIGYIKQVPSGSRMLRRHLRYIKPTMQLRYEVSLKPSLKYHMPLIKKRIDSMKETGIERVRDIAERSRKRIDYRFERL